MASLANSTRAPSTHHRSESPRSRQGIGAIMLNGPVMFDANRRPQIGDAAVVIIEGGSLAVREVVEGHTPAGPGHVYVMSETLFAGSFVSRSLVPLVGVVIDPLPEGRRADDRMATTTAVFARVGGLLGR